MFNFMKGYSVTYKSGEWIYDEDISDDIEMEGYADSFSNKYEEA